MKLTATLLLSALSLTVVAQVKWVNPLTAGYPVVQNQGWINEIGGTYARLPERAQGVVRDPVWYLSRNSSGLAIHFYSDSPSFQVRYQVAGGLSMPHMPTLGVSGLDLYVVDSDGNAKFCSGDYAFGDTVKYNFTGIDKNKYGEIGYEFRLYLPLYNTVKWLEIGMPEGKKLEFIPASAEKPIVLYGTSIAQGGCASRPAMAWSTIVQRAFGYPLINLGFSGNGRMEGEVVDFVNELDARLYILDCVPNLSYDSIIKDLTVDAVRKIRKSHDAPILLVEHAGGSNSTIKSTVALSIDRKNEENRKAFEALKAEGVKNLYYLSRQELNLSPDSWVDYAHPTDLGMTEQAKAVIKKVREILNLSAGDTPTTTPVSQRKEPYLYGWLERHNQILAMNKANPPRSVILGNSIVNYWSGEPTAPQQHGKESWDKWMNPEGFRNLGFGCDQIENVLWRVYHGELDGYKADKVVLMIGTNNLGKDDDDEIVTGLRNLMSVIRRYQPTAKLKIVGLLPRRNDEGRVAKINRRIRQVASEAGWNYLDVGEKLLQKDGKIDNSLFSDGLHPNEEGYKRIAKRIAE